MSDKKIKVELNPEYHGVIQYGLRTVDKNTGAFFVTQSQLEKLDNKVITEIEHIEPVVVQEDLSFLDEDTVALLKKNKIPDLKALIATGEDRLKVIKGIGATKAKQIMKVAKQEAK
jgi:5'-3' exonuclease